MSSPDMRELNTRMRELEEQLGVYKLIKGVAIILFCVFVLAMCGAMFQ